MANRPTAAELVEAIREHLERKVQPELRGALAYENRVAVNVLRILERELRAGAAAESDERRRLGGLLASDGTTAELNARLCDRIVGGEVDVSDPHVIDCLYAITLQKLAIDSPRYSAYERARQHAGESTAEQA